MDLQDGSGYWGLRFHWLVALLSWGVSGGFLYCTYNRICVSYQNYDSTFIDLLSSAGLATLLFLSSSLAAEKGTSVVSSSDASALTLSVVRGGNVLLFCIAYCFVT